MPEIHINNDKKITIDKIAGDILLNGKKSDLEVIRLSDRFFKVIWKNKIYSVRVVEKTDGQLILSINNLIVTVSRKSDVDQILERLGMNLTSTSSASDIKAPMPGTILSIEVESGTVVEKGDAILILEAMKMENIIKSTGTGTVGSILVKEGENVEKNQLLITMG